MFFECFAVVVKSFDTLVGCEYLSQTQSLTKMAKKPLLTTPKSLPAQVRGALDVNDSIVQMIISIHERLPIAPSPYCIFVSTLACDDINVVKSIPVTIEKESDESFIASFVEAGISSGGNSMQDAVWSLQEIIASSFRMLERMPNEQLGPKMRREKAVLLEFLCPYSQKTMQKPPQKS